MSNSDTFKISEVKDNSGNYIIDISLNTIFKYDFIVSETNEPELTVSKPKITIEKVYDERFIKKLCIGHLGFFNPKFSN